MKKHLLLGLALAAALVSPALAADPAPRTLSMNGHGEIRTAPDVATINAGVTTSGPTAAAALSANSARMNGVFAGLKKLGVADKNIQTTGFNVSPQYTNGENNSPRRLTGYQVNNDVSVRLDDVAKAGGALDALVAAGANQMNGISFGHRRPGPVAGKSPDRGHRRRPRPGRDLCPGGGGQPGAHPVHQRRRRRRAAPAHVQGDGHVHGPHPRGGRPAERDGRCLGGMGNPLTL